jgi:hypothetical protein
MGGMKKSLGKKKKVQRWSDKSTGYQKEPEESGGKLWVLVRWGEGLYDGGRFRWRIRCV